RLSADLESERRRADQAAAEARAASENLEAERQRSEEATAALAVVRHEADDQRAHAEAALAGRIEQAEARARALEAERQQLQQALAETKSAIETERERPADATGALLPTPAISNLSAAIGGLEATGSLADALTVAVRAASAQANRAALFVVRGNQLD